MNWMTEPTEWNDLIQVTDEYVVHGRGFTVGNDIWLDEYALRLGHHRSWNDLVRHHYDYPKWESGISWTLYSARVIDKPAIYWSINGNKLFIVQYPRLRNMDRDQFELVEGTLDALNMPGYAEIRFENVVEEHSVDSQSHAKSIINPEGNSRSEQLYYDELNGLSSIKWM